MTTQTDLNQLSAIASRLREMREILGWTPEDMAEITWNNACVLYGIPLEQSGTVL